MADTIQRVEYFYAQVPNKAGEGARFLTALQEAGINLLAFSGFPRRARFSARLRSRRSSRVQAVRADGQVEAHGPKRAFLVSGEERVGAMAELHRKLAEVKINVTLSTPSARAPAATGPSCGWPRAT